MVKYIDNNSGFSQWNAQQNTGRKSFSITRWLWWTIVFIAAWWLVGIIVGPKNTTVTPVGEEISVDVSDVPVTEIVSDKIAANIQGLRISNIRLADFNVSPRDSEPVALLNGDTEFVEVGFVSNGAVAPSATTVWRTDGDTNIWRSNTGLEFRRTISAENYIITISDEIINRSASDAVFAPYARIMHGKPDVSSTGVATGAISYANSGIETNAWRKLDKKSYAYTTTSGFTGFADQYWETIVAIDSPDQTIRTRKQGDIYTVDVGASVVSVPAGKNAIIKTHLFAGPRDQNILNDAAHIIPGVNRTIDYGWFWFLAQPMLWLLNVLNTLVMNYGLAIILMTIVLRLLIWPLTRKSYASMIAMQRMQPEMQRIQKLYANDKMRLQMEMMKLYRTHKTSPMSGCLPMLLQIPIFFALYKALLISVPMRNAGFLWIADLSVMDPYFILPILMGATMWWQQRLQSATRDMATNEMAAATNRVMRWMPIVFTLMFAWMPAGLGLYWTISNVFGIAQMWIMKNKK